MRRRPWSSPLSSPRFDDTIELAPQPSARAVITLFWVHTVPLVLLLASPLDGPVMGSIALGIGVSWLWLRRHPSFGYGPRALVRLRWHGEGHWTLEDRAGARADAQLSGNSIVLGQLLVLNFNVDGGGRRTRILMGDELDADLQRRLRARLSVAEKT